MIAAVPLITNTYGLNQDGTYCHIYTKADAAFIERLALWDGPAMAILLAASSAMVVVVIKLIGTICLRSKYEATTNGDRFWKAVKHLLPLAAFPIMFFLFEIPVLIFHIVVGKGPSPNMNKAMVLLYVCSHSFWSMASGGTLLTHIFIARFLSVAPLYNRKRYSEMENNPSARLVAGGSSVKSATYFSFPPVSV